MVEYLLKKFMAVVGASLTTLFIIPFVGTFEGSKRAQHFVAVVFLCTALSLLTWSDYEFAFIGIVDHAVEVAQYPLFVLAVLRLIWIPLNRHRKGRFWEMTREYVNRIYSKHFISFIDTPFFVSLFIICWLHLLV